METFIAVTLLRLLVPLLILKYPIFGILFSILADMYDWQLLPLTTQLDYENYQVWDKMLDFYYHIFILIVALRIKDLWVQKTAVILFLYRITGLVIAYYLQNRDFLFYFPNLFENFVLFFFVSKAITKREILTRSPLLFTIILLTVSVPKIINEYFQHFLLKQPWEVYDIGEFFQFTGLLREYTNYLSWGSFFYLIPLGLLLVLTTKSLNKRNLQSTKPGKARLKSG